MARTALLRRVSGGTTRTGAKYWPRKMLRTNGYVPYEIYGSPNNDLIGYLWINKATLVGAGGTSLEINDASSLVTLSP